ncbi:MAG: hypothetical protein PHO26_02605 [Dehalococcoidia bacterium]|nr:hypothetical protein [Dehalococcoidia bacterium]MDD5493797.1 hypothetical protein [Dehalococcoidia bacterium]
MYLAGLILTVIGWAFQLYETLIKKTRNINIFFPLAYFFACVLFGVNSLTANDMTYAILDFVCAILAAVVFIVLVTRKK